MALNAGSVAAGGGGSGFAKELYDDYAPKLNIAGAGSTAAQQQVADLCNSIATTLFAHFTTNAEVLTSVSTVVAAAIPVTVVPATGIGATTAPGVGSGAGTGAAGTAIF